jgi:(1->4)-alpha-D-glucan 1-alpha-D-glucosylmutase
MPEEWNSAVLRWEKLALRHRTGSGAWPDKTTEWLIYQTLIGAWPIGIERLGPYLEKATREAKVHTSWTDPNPNYDAALQAFAAALLDDGEFVADLAEFAEQVTRPGWSNSLAQKLLTLTGPGVPDLYQGTEIWDLSLVDPDNRRPVDFPLRQALLRRGSHRGAATAWRSEDGSGLTKLEVVRAALGLRAQHPEWFGPGAAGRYTAMTATGPQADHLVACTRGLDPATGDGAITLATRLPVTLERNGGWGSTRLRLPPGRWYDRLAEVDWEGEVPLGELLAGLPVALLTSDAVASREAGEGRR